MNIAFFTEGNYVGKVPREFGNARVDIAWQIALDAYHLPLMSQWPENLGKFDLGIWIIPKKNIEHCMLDDSLAKIKAVCNKVAIMQEGPSWFFQDYPIDQQVWFYNMLCSVDILFAHNYQDMKYLRGLTNHNDVRILKSTMVEDSIDLSSITPIENRKGVIIGGNFVRWYGGFDSYIVANQFFTEISATSMGRKQLLEEQLVHHVPYISWSGWISALSSFKYAIHLMPTQAAGTFALNCAYLGIPNIGYYGLDTQEVLHPNLTVEMGDIEAAKSRMQMLVTDQDFYNDQSEIAKTNYNNIYNEESFKIHFYDKFNIAE
jgi:hypothetical protein